MTVGSTGANPVRAPQGRPYAGPFTLAAAGALFVLYPVVRPYSDETTMAGADAFAAPTWIVAHLCAVVGFVLLPLGLLSLRTALASGPRARSASAAFLMVWIGVGLTLPYYGAEVFALNAIGDRVVRTGDTTLLQLVEAIRLGPVQATAFATGLLLIAAGTILAAVAVWRSDTMPRWSSVPLATGFTLFLPQFFGPPPLRIVHGVLVGVGCLTLAAAVRASRRP
ncbi:MAG: hypothetical protein H0V92_04020 [Pseudonocardiales bacterium]|nr:hypothetical protein [Pseudonocardiales bacterium]